MNTYECVIAIMRHEINWDDLEIEDQKKIEYAVQSWYNWRMAPWVVLICDNRKMDLHIRGVYNVNNPEEKSFLFINQPTITPNYTKLELMDKSLHNINENRSCYMQSIKYQIQLIGYSTFPA